MILAGRLDQVLSKDHTMSQPVKSDHAAPYPFCVQIMGLHRQTEYNIEVQLEAGDFP